MKMWNETNFTGELFNARMDISWKASLRQYLNISMPLIQCILQLSMGCDIEWKNILEHMKRPISLSIGMFTQFLVLPLSTYIILIIFGINDIYSIGILILACCPGGALSNTFTYFSGGDLPLSVTMTFLSTLLANVMLPANIWLYGRRFESEDLVIPYKRILLAILFITVPISIGLISKWKLPRLAFWITKVGSVVGLLLILVMVSIEILVYPEVIFGLPSSISAISATIPALGWIIGYSVSALFKQHTPVRKAIAIECGIQNLPLAISIITLSFSEEVRKKIVAIPYIFGIGAICLFTTFSLCHQVLKQFFSQKNQRKGDEYDVGESINESYKNGL